MSAATCSWRPPGVDEQDGIAQIRYQGTLYLKLYFAYRSGKKWIQDSDLDTRTSLFTRLSLSTR